MKALLDVNDGETPAVAIRGQGIELAGTAIGAIAVAELAALDLPFGHGAASFARLAGWNVTATRRI
jgi:hypothetical protein